MNSAAGDIAAAFVNARRNWKTLPEYPGERPSDLRSAYVIQDAALADWNRPIGGWKVGKINPPMSAASRIFHSKHLQHRSLLFSLTFLQVN